MHYVYVLSGHMRHPLYIGVTNNLQKRFSQHKSERSSYTRKSGGWKLVYYEAYANQDDAYKREKSLKKFGSAYGHLKKRIARSIVSGKGGIQYRGGKGETKNRVGIRESIQRTARASASGEGYYRV